MVWSCGGGTNGELGFGIRINYPVPKMVDYSGVLLNKVIVNIAAGDALSVYLDSEGKLYSNGKGSCLGNTQVTNALYPVEVDMNIIPKDVKITQISTSGTNTVALDASSNQYFAFGLNIEVLFF